MDTFMEKLVTKRKTAADYILTVGILLSSILLIIAALMIPMMGFNILIVIGVGYLAYWLITSRNVEYEYIVTNGELDIDKIISRRKRKRVFSANCREFDVVSSVNSNGFEQSLQSIKNRIDASSSIDSPDAYYITLNYSGEKTLVIFEPSEKMLNNFRTYIPRKVLKG